MATQDQSAAPRRYDGWELRPCERVLCVGGREVQIGSRACDLLLALVERDGRVVSKSELLDRAWPGLVVEENNISVQIAALRKVLGPHAITTVPGIGYRLSAKEPAPDDAGSHRVELLGREEDLAALRELAGRVRLTSIVGPGGVGKTSLARDLFEERRLAAGEPTYWIDLAPIRLDDRFVHVLAKALGMELAANDAARGELVAALGQMTALIVLDNCEHLLSEICAFVGPALRDAPTVRWLTTTQEPLHVTGEAVLRLEPLKVPATGVSPAQAMECGSVALLCKRAVAADQRFRLTNSNVEAAVALCAQLDGLPLAIEMAATRVATFGLEEVSTRLGQRLRLLAGAQNGAYRHDTLLATFEWSFGLLTEVEQIVFRRLEPFLSGFTAGMAEQVAADADDGGTIDVWQAFNALNALVDKSLVQRSEARSGRFHLLESARDYARLRLDQAGEAAAVRGRHARVVAMHFADAPSDAERMSDARWLARYGPERHNVLAALGIAAEQRVPDDLARLVTALAMMDLLLCRQAEILQYHVPLDVLAEAQPSLRALAYLELSWSHYQDGNRELGTNLAEQAYQTFTALGDAVHAYRALAQFTRLCEARPGMAQQAADGWAQLQSMAAVAMPLRTHLFCGISAGLLHRPDFTAARMQELGQLAHEAGFEGLAGLSGCNATDKMLIAGRDEEAAETARRLLSAGIRLPRARAFVLHHLALALIRLGRIDEAYAPAQQAFHAMPSIAHFLIDTFALVAARAGLFADAALLSGCGRRIREERHERPDLAEAAVIEETQTLIDQGIAASRKAELMQLGAAMSAAEALAIKVFPRDPLGPAMAGRVADASSPPSSLGVA